MRVFILILVIITGNTVLAQENKEGIKGKIEDGEGKPVVSASVSLVRSSDSSLVKAALTDKTGQYQFVLPPAGNYLLIVTAVGFEKKWIPDIKIEDKVIELPVQSLNAQSKDLGGVTVTARKPFIETKLDRTVVNVEASPTNAGATALEVLEKSPGIQVNNDGMISLRGKNGVIILVDGKQTFLSATDLANMLRNMPASALDQIEIMTNPSAKYDASGNSGVINIKTKKGKNNGFNGSVMVGASTSIFESDGNTYFLPKSQNSFNFNYRKNKWNVFGNYNPNMFRGRNKMEISRVRFDQNNNPIGYNNVSTRFRFGNNNHTLKLGADYAMDKKNSFGLTISGFEFHGMPVPRTTTSSYDASGNLQSRMVSLTENDFRLKNATINLNYKHSFDTTGKELFIDLDHIVYDNVTTMQLSTEFYDSNGLPTSESLLLKGNLPSSIKIYTGKMDLVLPYKGGKLEAGIKTSLVKNDNLVDYLRWYDQKWVSDNRSNHFLYDENINAAYINGSTQKGKWSFQAGLRLENTIAKGFQVTNDSTFKRNFTDLFPSAFIKYDLSEKNSLTINYSRRINRPNYQDLNPFIYFLDSLSYRKGNPFLLPQFSHNMELSHSYKSKFITTLSYSVTNDVISMILKPNGDLIYMTSENVARFRNMGVAVTAPFTFTKWWNSNFFLNVYNNRYEGLYDGRPIEIAFTSFNINMTQTFTLKKGYTAEITGFYRARGVNQLNIDEPMYVISFGAQKTVMNGKGTVRLNLRDPFWIQRYKGSQKYDIVDSRINVRWDNRQVGASFTYRFGKNGQQNRRRNSASQEEMNRVGQGG